METLTFPFYLSVCLLIYLPTCLSFSVWACISPPFRCSPALPWVRIPRVGPIKELQGQVLFQQRPATGTGPAAFPLLGPSSARDRPQVFSYYSQEETLLPGSKEEEGRKEPAGPGTLCVEERLWGEPAGTDLEQTEDVGHHDGH